MESILITGGAGFIGSNFIQYFLEKYNNYNIINFDMLTYAGDNNNLQEVHNNKRYTFVQGDITNKLELESVFNKYNIKHVIHFAAESHVDNSISNPTIFAQTNVIGTLNLLEVSRNKWMESASNYHQEYQSSTFHHISTDEVYGTLAEEGFFTENTPYAPNSPYSASKASSDMFVRSYYHTYGMRVVTTNCSNNYGPKQHDEKLVPTLIRKALSGEKLPIYGDGKNIRDWLYVLDHCRGIDLVFHKGNAGETYVIGGNNEKTTLEMAQNICELLDQIVPKESSYLDLITFVSDRPGHDFRYAIDSKKIRHELNWSVVETFESGMLKTIEWYIKKYQCECE